MLVCVLLHPMEDAEANDVSTGEQEEERFVTGIRWLRSRGLHVFRMEFLRSY